MTVAHPPADRPSKLVAARIRRARKAAGLSQNQLARRLDVTLITVQRWEHARNMPAIDTLYRIAAALGIRAQDLFPDQDEGP